VLFFVNNDGNNEKGRNIEMRDRGLENLLMIIFGTGGVVILTVTLAMPRNLVERLLSGCIGTAGVAFAACQLAGNCIRSRRVARQKVPVRVKFD
jgi:hypothetical protein